MSRIALSTLGSTGEARPFAALAKVLTQRGHEVRVCTHAHLLKYFDGLDVQTFASGNSLPIEDWNEACRSAALKGAPLDQFQELAEAMCLREATAQREVQLQLQEGVDAVVTRRYDTVAQGVAMQGGRPWASMALVPDVFPTRTAPPLPMRDFGPQMNAGIWMNVMVAAQGLQERIRETLEVLDLPIPPLGIAGSDSPHLNLVAASGVLSPARADWADHTVLTGAWAEATAPEALPEAVQDFLAEHSRPVLVSFGSMGGEDHDETADIIVGALQQCGRPAIVQSGWQSLTTDAAEILNVGYLDHDGILPKVSCIVHHAGSGTAHAAARAGVPSVCVPHLFDQYYWGYALAQANISPEPILRPQLSIKRLANAIDKAMGLADRAEDVAAQMQSENGALRAAEAIEARLLGAV